MKTRHKKPKTQLEDDRYTITELDIYNLHTECQKQDSLVRYWGEKLARARLKWEHAKAAASIFEAETSREVRLRPKRFNVSRLTEAAIKEVVGVELLKSEKHKSLVAAKHKVDILEVVMRQLEHRKKALESCVFLHGQQYYSQPKRPKESDSRVRGLRH